MFFFILQFSNFGFSFQFQIKFEEIFCCWIIFVLYLSFVYDQNSYILGNTFTHLLINFTQNMCVDLLYVLPCFPNHLCDYFFLRGISVFLIFASFNFCVNHINCLSFSSKLELNITIVINSLIIKHYTRLHAVILKKVEFQKKKKKSFK